VRCSVSSREPCTYQPSLAPPSQGFTALRPPLWSLHGALLPVKTHATLQQELGVSVRWRGTTLRRTTSIGIASFSSYKYYKRWRGEAA